MTSYKIPSNIIWGFALLILMLCSCNNKVCIAIDDSYIHNIDYYEKALNVINKYHHIFKREKYSTINRAHVNELIQNSINKDFTYLLSIWDNNYLRKGSEIVININPRNNHEIIIFEIKKCKNYSHSIIYDPNNDFGIGIADDIAGVKQKTINENWIYYVIWEK
jgi:hypothetical protein